MKKLTEIVAEGEYSFPFNLDTNIKRCKAPSHKKLGLVNCMDWAMSIGTPILAARDGIVIETESRFDSHGGEDCIDTNYVVIEHGNNESSVYVHLKWRGVKVKKGQKVKAGQLIGYSGQTGFATYPHLHFGVYKNWRSDEEVNVKVDLK